MSHLVTHRSDSAGDPAPGDGASPAPRASRQAGRGRRRASPTARQQRRAACLFLAPACVMVAIYVIWPVI
ncbi:MAG: sugar ABC transporter permease, partial [Burkholderiales bacterium]|nr:sugar ABC transporter permease [Burkholderiales bacterium]